MSGVTYWTVFFPADTVKSYIQTDPRFKATPLLNVAKEIYLEHGVAGLYRGWGVTVLRAAPAHALIFASYEYQRSLVSLSLSLSDILCECLSLTPFSFLD